MISEISYGGWKRNLQIDDGVAQLVVTLDVGPRILFGAPSGKENLFCEMADQLGGVGEAEWKIRGGHRFWTAPENDESYALDNSPVSHVRNGDAVEITGPETVHGWQKTLSIKSEGGGLFTIGHTLRNTGTKPLEVTPWALSVMRPGGTAVLPQPSFSLHPCDLPPGAPFTNDDFQANRRVVLWKYTDLADPRFRLEQGYWFIDQKSPSMATKFGLLIQGGWVAYQRDGAVFAKTVPYIPGAAYPDDGVNFELFTNKDILELETLAPIGPIPVGGTRLHVEQWIFKAWAEPITTTAGADAFFKTLPKV